MTDTALISVPEPSRDLSCQAAIVGAGVTDFASDYHSSGRGAGEHDQRRSTAGLAKQAVERALADCGLDRGEVDGLGLTLPYGGPDPHALARDLGITANYFLPSRGVISLTRAAEALAAGRCNTIALLYAVTPRSMGRLYGGQTYAGSGRDSYYYYHPWGWSSQAAHWALMLRHYMALYGTSEADLGSVALTLRRHAERNENAIMRRPLALDDYLAARYIVRPLRLLDLCLVNDGAICLIVRRADMAHDGQQDPVFVAGWGDATVSHSKMQFMAVERLRDQFRSAADIALAMAGRSRADIGHFQGYDPSSIHLVNQLEGYGFVKEGEGLEFCKDGQIDIGGELPSNTNGGMLSEAYLHGWSHLVEAVRQLRHQAGARQVEGVHTSMFSFATTEEVHPIILARAE